MCCGRWSSIHQQQRFLTRCHKYTDVQGHVFTPPAAVSSLKALFSARAQLWDPGWINGGKFLSVTTRSASFHRSASYPIVFLFLSPPNTPEYALNDEQERKSIKYIRLFHSASAHRERRVICH